MTCLSILMILTISNLSCDKNRDLTNSSDVDIIIDNNRMSYFIGCAENQDIYKDIKICEINSRKYEKALRHHLNIK